MRPIERLQMGLQAADMLALELEQRAKEIRNITERVRSEFAPDEDVIPTLVWTNVNRMVLDQVERMPRTIHFVEHMISGAADR